MKKQYVYNQKGYLLIEHLMALFLTSILTAVIIALLQVLKSHHVEATQITQHEIETLTTRLNKEVRRASSISASQNRLILHFSDTTDKVSYHVQNNRLTRQINSLGGEIALYHCKKLTVELLNDHSVKLELISAFDDIFNIYLSTLTFPIDSL